MRGGKVGQKRRGGQEMSTADAIFGLVSDIQRVKHNIQKLDESAGLSRFFPRTLEDVYEKLYEASSDLADYWGVFAMMEGDDIENSF